jgi:hypothetical protein
MPEGQFARPYKWMVWMEFLSNLHLGREIHLTSYLLFGGNVFARALSLIRG